MHRTIKDFLKEEFEIIDKLPETNMDPHHVDMWYNRGERAWVVQLKSEDDYQIGDAEYVGGGKELALQRKKDLEKEHNL